MGEYAVPLPLGHFNLNNKKPGGMSSGIIKQECGLTI